MSDIPTFSPLVHAYTDALRFLRERQALEVGYWADSADRVRSNVKRDAVKLAEAGVITFDGTRVAITDLGRQFLTGQDIAQGLASAAPAPAGVITLRHDQIVPDPDNARRDWDSNEARLELDALRSDILEHGLLQNLVVRPASIDEGAPYALIGGERRWRAIGLAIDEGDWPEDRKLACRLIDADALGRRLAALSENLQRRNLNPLEKAQAFEGLAQAFADQGVEPDRINRTISDRIGTTIEHVQQHRSFMKLDPADQARLALPKDDPKRLSVRDARAKVTQKTAKDEAWKPTDQSPEEQLLLAELAYLARGKSSYMGNSFIVGPESRTDPVALRLAALNIIHMPEDLGRWNEEAGQFTASFRGWALTDAIRSTWPALVDDDVEKRAAGLRALQAELAGEAPTEGATFLTGWLNGPFALTEAGLAIVEEQRQAAEARQRDNQAAAEARAATLTRWGEARSRHLAILNAAAETAAAGSPEDNQAIAAELDRPLPWRLTADAIVAANGEAVRRIGQYHGAPSDQEIALAQMTVVAVNAAGGQVTPPPVVAEDEESLDRAAFEAVMTEAIDAAGAGLNATSVLDDFLSANAVEFGEEGWIWSGEGARELVEEALAEDDDAEEAA